MPSTGGDLARLDFGSGDLNRVRRSVAAVVGPLIPERVSDIVLAVHEVAANSIVHGAGDGSLRVWSADGELVFEVVDSDGKTTVPTMAHAAAGDVSGRGLWLAQRLTDAMAIDSTPDRTAVQLRVRLPTSESTTAGHLASSTRSVPSAASCSVGYSERT
jgi:anti-sigma regulatory factor (Ser/Thr protein kinase)